MKGKTKFLILPKMARNTNWKICLIIGISSFGLLINNGCNRDYAVRAKWLYINETGYNISYLPESIKLKLPPKAALVFPK